MSSRERVLTALSFQEPDYVPCSFGAYSGLEERCSGRKEFVRRQLDMGLDPPVFVDDLPIRFDRSVEIREWKDEAGLNPSLGPYPILHCEYRTPAGTLSRSVRQTEDWPDGDHIPFLSDHTISRATRRLVTSQSRLDALGYLLQEPTREEIEEFLRSAADLKRFAGEHGLFTAGRISQHADFACWLSGIQELTLMSVDAPEFLREYLGIIEAWNRRRIEVTLDAGIDIFIRRGWYENADFWSPSGYREFLLPGLVRDVEQVHAAGARLGYIVSSSSMPLIDLFQEAGVDILMGIDPAQDRMMDLRTLKSRTEGRMALWGGVCGYLTVELGSEEEIREQVRQAIATLAPGGGFLLAPVTNVRADTDRARRNVAALVDEWKRLRMER